MRLVLFPAVAYVFLFCFFAFLFLSLHVDVSYSFVSLSLLLSVRRPLAFADDLQLFSPSSLMS